MNKTVRNIIIRISMLVGIVVFVCLMVMAKWNTQHRAVQKIKISIDDKVGNFFVNKAEVVQLINEKFTIKGKVLSGRDLEKIEKTVAIIPQVQYANAYTDDKGELNIKVIQRIPLFRVYNLQGQSFYVDKHGVKFATTSNYAYKVPVVTGNIVEACDSTRAIQSDELKSVFRVANAIDKNELWKAMIGQYNIIENAHIEMTPRFGNGTIIFGNDANIEQKLKRLDIFYFDVLRKVGWNYYKVINIMYKNQVVCLK
ncbi:MAG TPA: hypothetical protein PKY54_01370 [Chitinophagales bacterium]|nr:hypothetical protein [Chitinophagales bacterium]HMX60019.1 hypothetical protein [Chitinophagales bacterium]HMY22966.1 hypothetical protein [Chitinophagales bacterium]HMZ33837.1 hypothetical protein [Chitinophagales bacterium]HNA38580.1 hypothetical protein [Chitinophagales bacterium]